MTSPYLTAPQTPWCVLCYSRPRLLHGLVSLCCSSLQPSLPPGHHHCLLWISNLLHWHYSPSPPWQLMSCVLSLWPGWALPHRCFVFIVGVSAGGKRASGSGDSQAVSPSSTAHCIGDGYCQGAFGNMVPPAPPSGEIYSRRRRSRSMRMFSISAWPRILRAGIPWGSFKGFTLLESK